MLRTLVRIVAIVVVRFFHRQIAVRGRERVPGEGPVMVVSNHPNGLIDPMLIRIALRREVGFMAKATLFENPIGKLAMDAFAGLPVYRAKDGKDTSANERTFEAVRARFREGRWVVIFPEGHSHSEPTLQRMKTGAARICLSAENEADFDLGLRVLPIGLVYEDKERFRSRVAVRIGDPIDVADYRSVYLDDDWEAAKQLTDDIGASLARVVLEAETSEIWRGFLAVARWTSPDAMGDVAACEARARVLANAYQRLMTLDPQKAQRIAEEARHFVAMLDAIGVDNPYDLERPRPPTLSKLVRDAAWYAALVLPALAGWLLNAPPYYSIGPLARRVAGDDTDIVSTVKALAGMLLYPMTWVIEAAVVGLLTQWQWGIAALFAGPLTGIAAVHFFERASLRRDALVGTWLRWTRASVVDAVRTRRKQLAALVDDALSDVRSTTDSAHRAETPASR
jgi:1-acyl-sn-glycerol-3-phosphate acyltransferase